MRTVQHRRWIVWVAALAVSVLLFSPTLAQSNVPVPSEKITKTALPRMIDLGRNQCLPCKMMKPVLEELKQTYAGAIDIEYINIAENPGVMEKLGLPVRAVPFQIFYDGSGKIVKRHYGYMSREEILQAFKELGFDRKPASVKQR
jgi:thiol-disulfide isomerase/thioredoxin